MSTKEKIKNGSEKMIATLSIIVINIIMFAITAGGNKYSENLGCNYSLIIQNNEYYRLLTSMFFHFGIMHLLCNMYSLYNIGPVIENNFGHIQFLIVYFVTGLLGGAIAAFIHHSLGHNVLSAGASGAIMGILGFFVGSLALPFSEKISMIVRMCWPMIVIGFMGGIDNVAHFTCLVVGMIIAATRLIRPV